MAILKWSGIVVAVLVAGLVVLRVFYGVVTNPKVIDEITANPDGERAGIVMTLTLPDGRTLPVNYLREGERVYAGADGRWWRTLREGDRARHGDDPRRDARRSSARRIRRPRLQGGRLLSTTNRRCRSGCPRSLTAELVVIELGAQTPP